MSFAITAYNEALDFALDKVDDNYDSIQFLKMWREGDWIGIERDFPEFDLSNTKISQMTLDINGGKL